MLHRKEVTVQKILRGHPETPSTATSAIRETTGVNQLTVPLCRIGRVTTRDDVRSPEVAGTVGLYNAGPIGEWKVAITPSIKGPASSELEDVHLDFYLAYRAPTVLEPWNS
jgi:hypothetical protein